MYKKFIIDLSLKVRLMLFILSLAVYVYLLVNFSNIYKANIYYSLMLPIIFGAYCFGLWGGAIAGTFGPLLSVIIVKYLMGDEYFPTNLIMLQITSMILGIGLGLTGSYLKLLHNEIDERKLRENELEIALSEKELLFKELNHRVNNSLNLVKSLIQLQIYRSTSKSFKREGEKLINRILSISLVHEQLYVDHLENRIEVNSYFKRLVYHIFYSQSREKIIQEYDGTPYKIEIPLDKAILLGLIINEIITNSLKYAFPNNYEGTPRIKVNLKHRHDFLILNIADNGIGLNSERKDGLGMTLVNSLSKQLNGDYGYEKSLEGTTFFFTMPWGIDP
jgi:two-component sensor histidine kinase